MRNFRPRKNVNGCPFNPPPLKADESDMYSYLTVHAELTSSGPSRRRTCTFCHPGHQSSKPHESFLDLKQTSLKFPLFSNPSVTHLYLNFVLNFTKITWTACYPTGRTRPSLYEEGTWRTLSFQTRREGCVPNRQSVMGC